MKKLLIFTLLIFAFAKSNPRDSRPTGEQSGKAATAQRSVTGSWKTIDDNTGEAKSIVNIYEKDGKLYGKVQRILKEERRDQLCTACKGEKKNEPVEGLIIIEGLSKDEEVYEDGTILDPENGKTYKAKIWLDENNPDILHVRGYVAFFYRTQDWVRHK
ncbi:DUF2147 domain-containing protein [Croceiramulus getboli]|nr:DUF2147 domain-containing protein [Flavobacteriaceae bacterium YJPT1-3]